MIKTYKMGRLGNALFQYSFSRILQERTGLYLDVNELKQKDIPEIENIHGKVISQNMIIVRDYNENEGKLLDLDSLCDNKNYGFIVDGFFQHKNYYQGKRDLIKSWLFNSEIKLNDTIAIHVRLTDYKKINWSLPYEYYEKCLSLTSCKNVLIFTDEPDHDLIKKMKIMGAEVAEKKTDIEDMKLMSSCQEIVMSRSSYSWWAAFLSNSRKIYFPRPSSGWWSLKDTPHKDLLLDYPEYQIVEI